MIWWCIVFCAVVFIGITKSGFGSGVGLMIVPMTAITMGHIPGRGSEAALGLLLPLLIAGDLIAVWQYFHLFFPKKSDDPLALHLQARAVIGRLMPGTIAGVVIGGLLLWLIHTRGDLVNALIRIEIGCESILLVSIHWWRIYRGIQHRLMPEPWRSYLTGSFAAISSTLAHAAGPIIAMYLLPLRWIANFTSERAPFIFSSSTRPSCRPITPADNSPTPNSRSLSDFCPWWLSARYSAAGLFGE